ncbi:MAG: hypothetical protein NTZ35_08820 [Ignavibacteriales bacterium]|nr:hypothetical protein [Ignavibacteriales bacterium]
MATKHEQWKQRVRKAHVPAYFKGLLIDASFRKVVRSANGEVGRCSFFNPGFELGRNVGQHIDADVLDELEKILDEPVKVAAWLRKHLNRFFGLVPAKRRPIFIEGFRRGFEENH